ncbi:hypothetical protein N7530_007906 [Penicillium desertorum]|uniref:HMA domain-containing protein n=1 Tax=Penicillium desertorum TaxID=1303715 RepID=A0A9W9WN54_9EURO|nr:hypothetical protein N7530_007906 [Penicillium desertorum]
MSDHQYKFHVQMGCGGCSRAIKKAVEALTGEDENSSICRKEQTVFVVAEPSLSYEAVLEAIKAKGKDVRSGEANGVGQSV